MEKEQTCFSLPSEHGADWTAQLNASQLSITGGIMRRTVKRLIHASAALAIVAAFGLTDAATAREKNPYSKNPCMMKNPCAAKNTPIRKNPIKDQAMLMEMANKLWSDTALGKSGLSCASCHAGGADLKKEPYPKYIKMTGDIVTMDQMINFCMTNPMKAKPLAWNSQEMTALGAYITANSKQSAMPMMKNPCDVKNPCSMKNPCMMKNPCGMK